MSRVIAGKSHPYDFWNGGKKETNIMNLLSTLLFLAVLPTITHNLPLQIDNTKLYQPTFNICRCTRISYWGKIDHFWLYPPIDGRMKYLMGMFNTFETY